MSANAAFRVVNEQGWRRGLANMLRKENRDWWRTRRWWLNTLIWLVLTNGILLAMLSTSGSDSASRMTPQQILEEAKIVFAVSVGLFASIGAVIAVQGALIDEKKSGTAAWIMSKPVSRPAFIIAKLVANTIALMVIILVIQGTVAYVQLSLYSGSMLPLGPFVAGMSLLALHMLFYVSLTLMLGTLFNDRGPVIGIPIGVLFSPLFIIGFVGQAAYIFPWLIVPGGNNPGLAVEAMRGQPLATTTPIIATMVWIVVFIGVALWRFQREEF
jgi:ABC-2 type transport system permease protein